MKKVFWIFISLFTCISFLFSDITLVGETHGIETIYNEELNLYRDFYEKGGRHYFMEIGYNTAQLLNFWMNREDDELLYLVHSNWKGTLSGGESTYNFLLSLKREFPQTIIHGIDVEHQFDTNGLIYMNYLERNGLQGSPWHQKALLSMEQGRTFYKKNSNAYREKCLTENFISEYEELEGESIFGVFGSTHTSKTKKTKGNISTMGMNLLKAGLDYDEYNLSGLAWVQIPFKYIKIRIDGNCYEAGYFGNQSLRGRKDFDFREFYTLTDCTIGELNSHGRKYKKTGNYLPQSNYPMLLEAGNVYVIDYYYVDGTMESEIHICDGKKKKGELVTYQVR